MKIDEEDKQFETKLSDSNSQCPFCSYKERFNTFLVKYHLVHVHGVKILYFDYGHAVIIYPKKDGKTDKNRTKSTKYLS
jgi:hypothetical protein